VPSHGLIYHVLAMQPGEMYCGAALPLLQARLPFGQLHISLFAFTLK
jgi:hypothetical protein